MSPLPHRQPGQASVVCALAVWFRPPRLMHCLLGTLVTFVPFCRQLSTDKIVTLSLVGSASMTFICKKRDHSVTVELPARTLQVLFCRCRPFSMLLLAANSMSWACKPCVAVGSLEAKPPTIRQELVHQIMTVKGSMTACIFAVSLTICVHVCERLQTCTLYWFTSLSPSRAVSLC